MRKTFILLTAIAMTVCMYAGKTFSFSAKYYDLVIEEYGAVVTLSDDANSPEMEFAFYFQTKQLANNTQYTLNDMHESMCYGEDWKHDIDESTFGFGAATYKQVYDAGTGKTTITAKVTTEEDSNVYNITYTGSISSGFDPVQVPATIRKIMSGQQLMILRDGKYYSILGF